MNFQTLTNSQRMFSQVTRTQYYQPQSRSAYPQPHPLNQSFNHGGLQPHLVPQQFHNHSTYNDRSWIDKAVAYRAFMQNQQAPQPYNQQRVPQIQAHYANYHIPNQQAPQPYSQHQVQANYQRDQLTHAPYSRDHAPYSLAPFGYPPISVNQHPFNYRLIKSPQAFNARAQSNQRSSTNNDSRNFQPVFINPEAVSYGHQIKPSFSPGYNQGFVAQEYLLNLMLNLMLKILKKG